MTPDASSSQVWKIHHLRNLVECAKIVPSIIAITETWIKPVHDEAQVTLVNYTVHRADRINRGRGGVLLYITNEITVTQEEKFDDDTCQAVFCLLPSIKLAVFSVYKPCDASVPSFSSLIDFINKCITDLNDPSYAITILGDFNFPDLWSPSSELVIGSSANEKCLLNFLDRHFLVQYVDVATRNSNILDLAITNNDCLFSHIKSESTILSDHNLVELLLSPEFQSGNTLKKRDPPAVEQSGFQPLNLFKAD